MTVSDSKAETHQAKQRDAEHSEQSKWPLAPGTVTIQQHNPTGLTHSGQFWQTSIQQGEGLARWRAKQDGRTVLTWEYVSLWKSSRGSYYLWFVLQFGFQWYDDTVTRLLCSSLLRMQMFCPRARYYKYWLNCSNVLMIVWWLFKIFALCQHDVQLIKSCATEYGKTKSIEDNREPFSDGKLWLKYHRILLLYCYR